MSWFPALCVNTVILVVCRDFQSKILLVCEDLFLYSSHWEAPVQSLTSSLATVSGIGIHCWCILLNAWGGASSTFAVRCSVTRQWYVRFDADFVQNVFVKSIQSRSGLPALLKICAGLRRRTRLSRRIARNDDRLPDRSRITSIWLS